ncbi:MAG: dockerin type I domain-containing protein [Gemmatimonadaceae bacterium]
MSSFSLIVRGAVGSAALLLGAVSAAAAQGHERDVEARVEMQRMYKAQRADASGKIPPNARAEAWRAFMGLAPGGGAFSAAADAAWRPIGPHGLFSAQESVNSPFGGQIKSGRITSIAVHPNDGRTIFVGAASGGVWKSTNGGHSWSALSDTHCSLAIGAIAIDPVNPNIVYAGTGEINNPITEGCGVLRSTDGGATWTSPTSNQLGNYHGGLVVDRATAGNTSSTIVLAANESGLFQSTNSGATWSRKIVGVAWSVVAHPTRPGTYFASVSNGQRSPASTIWKSTDSGASWIAMPTPFVNTALFARIDIAISRTSPDFLFALAADYNTRLFAGVFRWNEVNQQWTTLPATGLVTNPNSYPFTFGEQGEYNLVIAVDPRNSNRIWVAGVGAFSSEDGGATFRSTARTVHVDWHAISFDPNDPDHMFAGTDGGVYSSFDAGRSWHAQNNGLAIAQFYQGISVHPSGLWVYGGLQDNNAVYFTGSPVWNNLSFLGDGGYTVVNPQDPSTVYVTHAFLNFISRISRFKEEVRTTGISGLDRRGIPRPLVMDPANPATLYFGTQRLYRTTNEGQLWVPISNDLTRGSGFITTIALAPSNSQIIYVGTSDGVISVSQNGGVTFSPFVFAVARWFTEIVVDPTDPLHAIAVASTAGSPHATETRNGGVSFNTTIGATLPDIPVHSALFVPGTSTFLVGTDFGVLQTQNGGAQWTQGPPGLPATIVYDLAYAPSTGTVFASTHGRGIFAYRYGSTPTVLRGDVDGDGRVTAQDALLVQQALVGIELPPGRSAYPQGDANCDGRLQGIDVLLVMRAVVGLPNGSACVGTMFQLARG